MALNQSRMRSQLQSTVETKRLLKKIKDLLALSPNHVVFEKAGVRYKAQELGSVAIDETAVSANIQYKRPPLSDVAGTLVLQDLTYTGLSGNADDNDTTIEYVDDGTAGSETVGVVGQAITVHMEDGVSTATQIKAAIDGTPAAAALVSIAISGTGSNPQDAVAPTNLSGGVTANTLESYDIADIIMIKRLRTKKYLIKIADSANPA